MSCHNILLSFFDITCIKVPRKFFFDADRWILVKHCNFVAIMIFYKMASKQKKRKTVTEADIEEFIENLDDRNSY